jgi:hypothetical protein
LPLEGESVWIWGQCYSQVPSHRRKKLAGNCSAR